jgi:hypothetical protein
MLALNTVGEKYVVGRGDPFHCTTDDGVKLLPLTFSVTDDVPATAVFGFSDVMTGAAGTTLICELVAARV